jgi:hypothetical protein
MNKKNLLPMLFCIIFITLIWTITNFYSDSLTNKLSELKELQRKVKITQSFANQKSPAELVKRINEFAPETLDKGVITSELTQFAREANIEISSISTDEKVTKEVGIEMPSIPVPMNEKMTKVKNTNDLDANKVSINTFKSVKIILKITGGKREVYTFLQKLTQSKRYIVIDTVNLSFDKGLDGVEGTINAITYYK